MRSEKSQVIRLYIFSILVLLIGGASVSLTMMIFNVPLFDSILMGLFADFIMVVFVIISAFRM